jgi:hypothetical protein
VAIAIADGADLHPRGASRDHVRNRIANHEALRGLNAEGGHGPVENVGLWFAGEAISALDVVEVFDETELGEHDRGGGSAFSSSGGLQATEPGQSFGYARIKAGGGMAALRIDGAVFLDPGIDLFRGCFREEIPEQIHQMAANVGAKEIVGHVGFGRVRQDSADGATDVLSGIKQSAVNVEKIGPKGRDPGHGS